MDLTVKIGESILNIRVAAIMRNESGYIFERNPFGFHYAVGGRIKVNESSEDALKRELLEELNIEVKKYTFISIIENFFSRNGRNVHEINFVYLIDEIFNGELPENFYSILPEEFGNFDFRPKPIIDIIKNRESSFKHSILKQT